MPKEQKLPSIVKLNVGGHYFTTRLSTLLTANNSMLAAMFSGRFEPEVDEHGRHFIDRDGKYFEYILNYLRDPSLLPPSTLALQVYQEAKYFGIEGLINQLECHPAVIPITWLEDQKSRMGEGFEHWKQMIIDSVRQKYSDMLKYSLGQECMTTAVRYISTQDYLSGAMTKCKGDLSQSESGKENFHPHNFFYSNESCSHLSYKIGAKFPNVDFVIPEYEIKNIRMFTSVLEKDLLQDGFCVSGRSSHSWKCSRCGIIGYLHQIAFTWIFGHVHDSIQT